FRCQMYTCHLGVLRREVIDRVGGFRPGFDGSQDHDLVLRATEVARQVVHVPKLAYHWRMLSSSAAATGAAKPYAYVAGRQAVEDHLRRTSFPADVVHVDERPGSYRLLPRLSR